MSYLLTRPYLSLPEFKAAPTYLDLDDLVVGGTSGQEDSELTNVLLRASAWVDNDLKQPLGAHLVVNEQRRAKVDRYGRFWLHPDHGPVRQITGFSYGPSVASLVALAALAGIWIEGGTQVMVPLDGSGGTTSWSGPIQFGSPPPGTPSLVQYSYVAGWACSPLSSAISAGVSALPLVDATGIQPGDILRAWDPNAEEAVTVSAGFTPTIGPASVPLTAPTLNAHNAGASISGMPADLHQAAIIVACAMLLGRGKAGQPTFNEALVQPTTSGGGKSARRRQADRVDVLLSDARDLLAPYRRVI